MSKNSEIQTHEEYKQLNIATYHPFDTDTQGFELIDAISGEDGFFAAVYQKGGKFVISYRGTDKLDFNDYKNDIQMGVGITPNQYQSAIDVYEKYAKIANDKKMEVLVTGHSLGGSLAALVSATRGVEAVTFNPYGIKDLLYNFEDYNTDKITNYCEVEDRVTRLNANKHVGKSYMLYPNSSKNYNYPFAHHDLENMGDLSERIEFEPSLLKRSFSKSSLNGNNYENNKQKFLKIIEEIKNINNKITRNKILEDLNNLKTSIKEELEYENNPSQDLQFLFDDIKNLGSVISDFILSNEYELQNDIKKDYEKLLKTSKGLSSKYQKRQQILKGRVANERYIWHSEPNACDVCKSLDGTIFDDEYDIPNKPHPNCKCTVETIYY